VKRIQRGGRANKHPSSGELKRRRSGVGRNETFSLVDKGNFFGGSRKTAYNREKVRKEKTCSLGRFGGGRVQKGAARWFAREDKLKTERRENVISLT